MPRQGSQAGETAAKTPDASATPAPTLILQPHGGALLTGGNPGNRGGPGSPGSLGPVLPSSGLMPLQHRAVALLASGLRAREVAKRCGVGPRTVKEWLQLPQFVRAVEEATVRHTAREEELLHEGEVHAARTLLSALEAEKPAKSGKRVVMVADWDARIRAADSLLNRRGERGKPIERVQSANFNFNAPEVRHELVGALADPTVQKFLQENPAKAEQLRIELQALTVDAEVIDTAAAEP